MGKKGNVKKNLNFGERIENDKERNEKL